MSAFVVEVSDSAVQSALEKLAAKVTNPKPILQALGEDLMERTKLRFATSTGPDGQRWQPNARATLEAYIGRRGGFGKKGINKKGQALAISKKPLIGHSRSLSTQFHVRADATSVTVGNSMIYASTHQFGARVGEFGRYYQLFRLKYDKDDFRRHAGSKKGHPIPWGNIPARPFLPVRSDGTLYPAERSAIIDALNAWLEEN